MKMSKKQLKISIAVTATVILCIIIPLTMVFAKDIKVKSNTELGNKYLTDGKYEEAILSFEKIIAVDKKNIPARIGLAKASMAVKDYDKALKALQEVLELDKNNSEALKILCSLYLTEAKEAIGAKKYDTAEEAIDKALKLNGKDVSFYTELSDLYMQQGEIDRAMKLLKLGIANTNSVELKSRLAALHKDSTGNTSSNILNGGNVVEKDNWLYIATDNGIYKVDKNNRNSKTKLSNTNGLAQYLNIDKEYLYFCNYVQSGNTNDKGDYRIMKVKLDGSDAKTLTTEREYPRYLILKNDRLYYINNDGNIVSTDTEGKNAHTISKDKCSTISVGDEWIYYINENDTVKYSYEVVPGGLADSTLGKIYRVKLDGTGREKITEDGASFIIIEGDSLFFGNGSDGEGMMSEGDSFYEGKLYRSSLDGTNKKKLLDYASWSINIAGDYIYAYHNDNLVGISINSGEEHLIRKLTDGLSIEITDTEVFFDAWSSNQEYDYVYYKIDSFGYYSIRLDNTTPSDTSSSNTQPAPQSNNDFIIPYSSERKLTDSDLDGLSQEQLAIARNEIYARHGYIFTTDKYKQYFSAKSWYVPNASFNESMLSEIEKYNLDFIKQHE